MLLGVQYDSTPGRVGRLLICAHPFCAGLIGSRDTDAFSRLCEALGLVRLVKNHSQYEANEFRLRHVFVTKRLYVHCDGCVIQDQTTAKEDLVNIAFVAVVGQMDSSLEVPPMWSGPMA